MRRPRDFLPGDLICLKRSYRGLGHPDDFVVGLILSCRNKNVVMFTERNGSCSIEELRHVEMMYYERLR